MSHTQTFAKVVESSKHDNAHRLKDRAFAANRISKIVCGQSRRAAYGAKNSAVSELIRRGDAQLVSISFEPVVVVGLRFVDGGRLHTVPEELLPEARALILKQVLLSLVFNKSPKDRQEKEQP